MPASPTLLRAAERPRVEVAPAAVDTLADEAAALTAAAGLELEPWQLDGLRTMLSVREDGRWAAYEYAEICARQNGKTALFLARALAGFLLLDEQVVLWSAHEVKTAMRSWRDLRRLLRGLGTQLNENLIDIDGIPVKVNASNGQEGFERLDTGQEIKIVARSKGSGRGFSTDFMFVDEAFAYDELHQDALMPTLAARPNPQIGYASSPPLNGVSGAPMYALRRRAEAGGDETLGYRDWGLGVDLDTVMALPPDERDAWLDDRTRWFAANPAADGGRVTEESILRLRRAMSPAGFAREVLGLWPRQVTAAGGWKVLAELAWRARGAAADRPDTGLAFALDASWPDAAMGSIGLAGGLGGELLVQVVEHRPGTAWMVDRVVELHRRWPTAAIVLDAKSPAGHLRRELEDRGVPLVTPTAADVAHAFGRFVAAVAGDAPHLRHFDQPELDAAVKTAGTRTLGDGRMWARQHAPGADISPLTAVTLAAGEAARRGATPPPAPVPIPATGGASWATADVARMGF